MSAMWMVMVMVVDLRFYAERYVSAVYPEAGKLVFYLAMAVLELWIVREDLSCLLRAGKIFSGWSSSPWPRCSCWPLGRYAYITCGR